MGLKEKILHRVDRSAISMVILIDWFCVQISHWLHCCVLGKETAFSLFKKFWDSANYAKCWKVDIDGLIHKKQYNFKHLHFVEKLMFFLFVFKFMQRMCFKIFGYKKMDDENQFSVPDGWKSLNCILYQNHNYLTLSVFFILLPV